MEFLMDFMIPVILGICLCTGYIVKKWIKDVDNKYIPTLCAGLGVIIAVSINRNMMPETILAGMVSGLAATGMHEAFTQMMENGGTAK